MNKSMIVYDFDGTLTPYAWTKFAILEKCGLEDGGSNPEFVRRVKETAETEKSDTYESLWKVFFDYLTQNGFALTDENFALGADEIAYNPGVPEFLEDLNEREVDNYILSSGIKPFLNQTTIVPYFVDIFATTFVYDDQNVAQGIEQLVNEKAKVKILRQILAEERGDPEDASEMIYIGDGLTDCYAMDYVKSHGGQSIFVYQDPADKNLARLREKNAVSFATKADYRAGSELTEFIRDEIRG